MPRAMPGVVLAPAACHLAFRLRGNGRAQPSNQRRRAEEKDQCPGNRMACEANEPFCHDAEYYISPR
jgi:hypothetical protein